MSRATIDNSDPYALPVWIEKYRDSRPVNAAHKTTATSDPARIARGGPIRRRGAMRNRRNTANAATMSPIGQRAIDQTVSASSAHPTPEAIARPPPSRSPAEAEQDTDGRREQGGDDIAPHRRSILGEAGDPIRRALHLCHREGSRRERRGKAEDRRRAPSASASPRGLTDQASGWAGRDRSAEFHDHSAEPLRVQEARQPDHADEPRQHDQDRLVRQSANVRRAVGVHESSQRTSRKARSAAS
jgi:hypothetical protein